MRKKCIWNWNWHARKEIEYWDEWGKWHGFFTALSFIGSIIFIIGIPIPYLIEYFLVIYEEPFQYAITVILLTLPFVFYIETVFYERTYGGMLGDGVYYLNENGIQMEYYPHIYREIRWEDIDIIERRTFSTGSREEAIYGVREIFLFVKRVVLKKKRNQSLEVDFFMQTIEKRLYILDIQKSEKQSFVNIGVKKFEINENGLKG